jgi:hypothetical protein
MKKSVPIPNRVATAVQHNQSYVLGLRYCVGIMTDLEEGVDTLIGIKRLGIHDVSSAQTKSSLADDGSSTSWCMYSRKVMSLDEVVVSEDRGRYSCPKMNQSDVVVVSVRGIAGEQRYDSYSCQVSSRRLQQGGRA